MRVDGGVREGSERFGFRALRLRMKRRDPSPIASTETMPVCRASSCMFEGYSRTTTHFKLTSTNGVCKHLAGPARSMFRGEVTTLRNNSTTLTMTSNTTTVACAVRGLTRRKSRVMSTGGVCKKSFGLLRRALPGCKVAAAFISVFGLRRIRGTVRRGAGTICVRALNGPGSSMISVRTVTGVTRGRGVPLIMSGAFTAPCLMEPVRCNTSVIIRSTAGFVNKRKAAVNKIVVRNNGFS